VTTTPVIAVVDDDTSVREAMGRLLRSYDFRAELYASPHDLLAAPSLGDIACVVCDVQMPSMSGFALGDALRAKPLAVPVILMTAFAQEGDEARARAVGAAGFIRKPFHAGDIVSCIERALRLPR
jgi:FixJ family two-component response regulator